MPRPSPPSRRMSIFRLLLIPIFLVALVFMYLRSNSDASETNQSGKQKRIRGGDDDDDSLPTAPPPDIEVKTPAQVAAWWRDAKSGDDKTTTGTSPPAHWYTEETLQLMHQTIRYRYPSAFEVAGKKYDADKSKILIGVLTAPQNIARREAIRQTWAHRNTTTTATTTQQSQHSLLFLLGGAWDDLSEDELRRGDIFWTDAAPHESGVGGPSLVLKSQAFTLAAAAHHSSANSAGVEENIGGGTHHHHGGRRLKWKKRKDSDDSDDDSDDSNDHDMSSIGKTTTTTTKEPTATRPGTAAVWNYDYLLKTDDDSYIRWGALERAITKGKAGRDGDPNDDNDKDEDNSSGQGSINKKPSEVDWSKAPDYVGSCVVGRPIVDNSNNNMNTNNNPHAGTIVLPPHSDNNKNTYPPYAAGAGYLLSPKFVQCYAKMAQKATMVASIEDATVGLYAQMCNMPCVHSEMFVNHPKPALLSTSSSETVNNNNYWVAHYLGHYPSSSLPQQQPDQVLTETMGILHYLTCSSPDHADPVACAPGSLQIDPTKTKAPTPTTQGSNDAQDGDGLL